MNADLGSNSMKVEIDGISSLVKYADFYEELEQGDIAECRSCYGTGLDRDEEYDCPDCGGSGEIFLALRY